MLIRCCENWGVGHMALFELFQFYWNFINEFRRGISPAMLEGLTDHPWNWHEFLMYHYAV